MELKLDRFFKGANYSIGKLFINDEYFCDTLEDTDRGLCEYDHITKIQNTKVFGRTAIPLGRYEVTLNVKSAKFSQSKYKNNYGSINGYLPRLLNVKGFEGILIHIGNSHTDTDGCILVGENKVVGQVINSKATFDKLYKILKKAIDNKEQIFITIK